MRPKRIEPLKASSRPSFTCEYAHGLAAPSVIAPPWKGRYVMPPTGYA